jgi:hypothetical protein
MSLFKSHFFAMLVYALIVSVMIAFIKYDDLRDIRKYGLKIFIYMVAGVIVFSWVMYLF